MGDATTIYFAWCDPEELSSFGEAHARHDENVFSVDIAHGEGEFPSATLEIRNPRVGLLGPSRKRWAWISWRDGAGVLHPLLFGRLLGIPEQIQEEVVAVTFVARPSDYEAQKNAVAETLKVAPYWDPVWFSEQDRLDPDRVLEGRSALWHIDRVTHVVTVSDLVVGDDVETFDDDVVLNNSVGVSYAGPPVRKVVVDATVRWEQRGQGTMDATRSLVSAFAAAQGDIVEWINGKTSKTRGMLIMASGEQMLRSWPVPGNSVGGGWTVAKETAITPVGQRQTPPIQLTEREFRGVGGIGRGVGVSFSTPLGPRMTTAVGDLVGRGPGMIARVVDYSDTSWGYIKGIQGRNGGFGILASTGGRVNIVWVPLWRMHGTLVYDWLAARAREETVRFELTADVQPILTDPGEEDVVHLSIGPADVDSLVDPASEGTDTTTDTDEELSPPIGDATRRSYFKTDRGRVSLEHVIARARAVLLARSRAVDVTASVPIANGINLSCRDEAIVVDPRLPGGQARGKIKGYRIYVNGDTGEQVASFVIGCSVGRGGSPSASDGDPSYVEAGYVKVGYQSYVGQTRVVGGSVSYESLAGQPLDDDGIDLNSVTPEDFVLEATVTGGQTTQEEAVKLDPNGLSLDDLALTNARLFDSGQAVIDQINAVQTTVSIRLKSLAGGPFSTIFNVSVGDLHVPKTIDLEAES